MVGTRDKPRYHSIKKVKYFYQSSSHQLLSSHYFVFMSRLENRGEEAWAIFRVQYSFSSLFLCSFVKNIFLLRFDQLDFLLLLFLCMSSSTGQPLSFPLSPLKMNGELSFLLRNWSVRIFLILILSLIIGCSSSIKIDPPPPDYHQPL